MNFCKTLIRKILNLRSKNGSDTDPSQMWGRVFDLEKKQVVQLDGFSLLVMPNDYIGAAIIQDKIYEPHVTALIKKVLGKDDVFLDLGANLGYFTMLTSSIVKGNGKVIAFEPNPQNLQLIYSSILQNEAKNIVVYPYAVSNVATILRFVTVGSNGGVVTQNSKEQNHSLLVQSVTLDSMLKDEPVINFIKIDIEAHEPFALAGMVQLVRKHQPKIITEFHPWAMEKNNTAKPIEYLDQIFDLGYTVAIIKAEGELMEMSSSMNIVSYWASLGQETLHLDLFAQPTSH